jgi:hypothetical protein
MPGIGSNNIKNPKATLLNSHWRPTWINPLDESYFDDKSNFLKFNACLSITAHYGKTKAFSAFVNNILGKNFNLDNLKGEHITIGSYLERDYDKFIDDLNKMYLTVFEQCSCITPYYQMYDPISEQQSVGGVQKISHRIFYRGFSSFGIAFHGDSRHPSEIYSEGFLPLTAPNNKYAKNTNMWSFKDTQLDPIKYPKRVFWNKETDDIASETAISVARNVHGAAAFPLNNSPHIYIYAVRIKEGFDTEKRQLQKSKQNFFRPGEKAVTWIPKEDVLAHALCLRQVEDKFVFKYKIIKLPNNKFWSKNTRTSLTQEEEEYLDRNFTNKDNEMKGVRENDFWKAPLKK